MEKLISTACAFAVSILLVVLSLRYARRRGLLDLPGRRRSHALPTPRGGGVGVVAGALVAGVPALLWLPRAWPYGTVTILLAALLGVAVVGWRDDHASLSVWTRIGMHLLAALVVGAALLWPAAQADPSLWWWLLPVVFMFAGSINAHNFMDGIDGLLGQQVLFVFFCYALLADAVTQPALAAAALAAAAASAGFLLFNWPPARIFMGDVGSGTLGLLVAAYAGLFVQREPTLLWPCLILSSAFAVDAGLTLCRRMLGGRRWYTAHREHLYQWMVRSGWTHAQTGSAYMIWNLLIAAPVAWAAMRWRAAGPALFVALYVLAAVIWLVGKRACLGAARRSVPRDPA